MKPARDNALRVPSAREAGPFHNQQIKPKGNPKRVTLFGKGSRAFSDQFGPFDEDIRFTRPGGSRSAMRCIVQVAQRSRWVGYPHPLWTAFKQVSTRLAGPFFALASLVHPCGGTHRGGRTVSPARKRSSVKWSKLVGKGSRVFAGQFKSLVSRGPKPQANLGCRVIRNPFPGTRLPSPTGRPRKGRVCRGPSHQAGAGRQRMHPPRWRRDRS